MENMFEIASEKKYRFPFRGLVTTEDLYDLNKSQLNTIYQLLNETVKVKEVTLLNKETSEDKDLLNKIEIVKYIFNKKVEKENAILQEKEISAKKQKILEIISKKQDANLENTPVEELQKMLNEL